MGELTKIGEFRYAKLAPVPIWSAGHGENIVRLSEIGAAGLPLAALHQFESVMSISTFPVLDGFKDCVFAMSFETWMRKNWPIDDVEIVRFFRTDIELMYPSLIKTPVPVWRIGVALDFISISDVRKAGLDEEYIHMFEVDRLGSAMPGRGCYYDHDFGFFMQNLERILGEKMSGKVKVYFDTEFTKFQDMRSEPKLISIGCVAWSGEEFYAELSDTYQVSDCSDFVIETVLPLLERGDKMMLEAQCATRLKQWVVGLGKEVQFMSDSPLHDWPFVQYLFNFYGWPENLNRKCGYVYQEDQFKQRRYERFLADYWTRNHERMHHSLVDARSMQWATKNAVRRVA